MKGIIHLLIFAPKLPNLVVLLLLSSVVIRAQVHPPEKPSPLLKLDQLSESIEALATRVTPSVVRISTTGYDFRPESNGAAFATSRKESIGSGIIVDPTGYIMTNAHVIEGAHKITVTRVSTGQRGITDALAESAAAPYSATLIGVFKEADLALIKIGGSALPALSFADYTQLRQGQVVFAVGSPSGLQNSISMGIVSSVARQPDPDSPFLYIQTDTPINPGNSGGPLLNTRGEVVGMNTFILSQSGGNEGIGFAIPSGLIAWAYQQLRQTGHVHRPTLGIGVQAITPILAAALQLKRSNGVLITDVTPGGPGEAAGLHVNDIILSISGRPIDAVPAMLGVAFQHPPGDRLQLKLLRGDQELTVEVTSVEQTHGIDRLLDLANPASDTLSALGIIGVATNQQVEAILGPLRLPLGVAVAARIPTPSGTETRLQPSDVIHAINGDFVKSVAELRSALERIKPGDPVALLIERAGQIQYLAFDFE
jgi:serine protease Do